MLKNEIMTKKRALKGVLLCDIFKSQQAANQDELQNDETNEI